MGLCAHRTHVPPRSTLSNSKLTSHNSVNIHCTGEKSKVHNCVHILNNASMKLSLCTNGFRVTRDTNLKFNIFTKARHITVSMLKPNTMYMKMHRGKSLYPEKYITEVSSLSYKWFSPRVTRHTHWTIHISTNSRSINLSLLKPDGWKKPSAQVHALNNISLMFQFSCINGFRNTHVTNFSRHTDGSTDVSTDTRSKANLYASTFNGRCIQSSD